MYLSPDVFDPTSEFNYGFLDYFNFEHWPGRRPKLARVHQDQPQAYDLVIFCSPAYSIHYTRWAVWCAGMWGLHTASGGVLQWVCRWGGEQQHSLCDGPPHARRTSSSHRHSPGACHMVCLTSG